jgi:hypothetical protein
MSLLDLLISVVTALKDFLESLKPQPSVRPLVITAAAVSSSAPTSFVVPFFNYEIVVPAVIASRFGRRGVFVFMCIFFTALSVRLVQAVLRKRMQRKTQEIEYRAVDTADGSNDARRADQSSSPAALRPTLISSIDSLASSSASAAVLGREGAEKVLQGQDGRLYVAVQSQGFLRVWDADHRGRPIAGSREHSLEAVVEVENAEEECEQLLRHFSDREVSASLARQPSESSSFLPLPPPSPKDKKRE